MASPDISLTPPADGISSLSWSGDSNKLLVSSWDGSIQLHDTTNLSLDSPAPVPRIFPTGASVLASTFSPLTPSGQTAYSVGLDKRLREWDFERGENRVLGKADEPISSLVFVEENNAVVTGGWDKNLRLWDPRAATALTSTSTLPAKIYSLAHAPASHTLLVSMGQRIVHLYDTRMMAPGQELKPVQQRESALKFLTKSVACMIDGKGWASASVEGRIAVEYFDVSPEAQASKYAFRCHRHTVDGVECAYPINSLAYHPIHNTFVSGGSDATVSIWDHTAKKRMKLYPKFANEVSALAFSPDGEKLAIGVSYEHDNGVTGQEEMNRRGLLIKTTVMDDCRPKNRAAA